MFRTILLLAFLFGGAKAFVAPVAHALGANPACVARSAPVMAPIAKGTQKVPPPRVPGTRVVQFTGKATGVAVRATGKAAARILTPVLRPVLRPFRTAPVEMEAKSIEEEQREEGIVNMEASSPLLQTRPDYGEVRRAC